jgi:glyoxylase-like metal-dependent hydrolase (beta-lactamase superfamily II)
VLPVTRRNIMELYAIRYAENFAYANYGTVYKGVKNASEKVPGFIFLYYLAKYKDKVILFDTGFRDDEDAKRMGIDLIDVKEELKLILDDPMSIDTIFITHYHFDHINNLDLYQNPVVIISKPEYEIAMDKSPASVRKRLNSDNIVLVEDEYLYDDKFRFKVIGGHTPGSSVIYFEEDKKHYVIAGDECYACDNILKNIPNGNCTDYQRNEQFVSDAHQKGLIPLPYHDNKVMTDYKLISDNIARII